jgi:hypothetical protein
MSHSIADFARNIGLLKTIKVTFCFNITIPPYSNEKTARNRSIRKGFENNGISQWKGRSDSTHGKMQGEIP